MRTKTRRNLICALLVGKILGPRRIWYCPNVSSLPEKTILARRCSHFLAVCPYVPLLNFARDFASSSSPIITSKDYLDQRLPSIHAASASRKHRSPQLSTRIWYCPRPCVQYRKTLPWLRKRKQVARQRMMRLN